MNPINRKEIPPYIFIAVWTILNLVQAYFTELGNDESCYWMYSQKLDWGYFYHPPFVALIIAPGYWLFQNELGVRLITVLLSSATCFLLWKMVQHKTENRNSNLFFPLLFSILLMHIGGFFVSPDSSFIFFTALFLYLYKQYLEKDSLLVTVALGLCGACLLYSKYHGILLLAFVFLSNLKLVKQKTFWLIVLIIPVCLLPHLWWQIKHNFETFQYHLVDRSLSAYSVEQTINYVLALFLMSGPLVSFLLIYVGFKTKARDDFERALKFVFIGIFTFFFLNTFHGKVEENWTASGYVALVIFSFIHISNSSAFIRWAKWLIYPSVIILFLSRLYFSWAFIPKTLNVKNEFIGGRQRAESIAKVAGDVPVVFMNSYSKPSKYIFYTKHFSHTLNNVMYHKDQYDIWNIEETLQHKRVMLVPNYRVEGLPWINLPQNDSCQYKFIDNFLSYYRIGCTSQTQKYTAKCGDWVNMDIQLKNNFEELNVNFNEDTLHHVFLSCVLFHKNDFVNENILQQLTYNDFKPGATQLFNIRFKAPETPGEYDFLIGIKNGILPPGLNSNYFKLTVK